MEINALMTFPLLIVFLWIANLPSIRPELRYQFNGHGGRSASPPLRHRAGVLGAAEMLMAGRARP
jgi:hypothetical protein